MFVGERMSHPLIAVPPHMPINEALHLMRSEHIRRTPVVDHGKLVGIISAKDLLNASPSPATSLSVWELNYLISKITVEQIMTRQVLTVTEETPIEEAARIMADSRIGGLPVMRGDHVVGIITETDLFKVLLELMGARDTGVRVTVVVPDTPGQFAQITGAIANAEGNIIAMGTFTGDETGASIVTLKVAGIAAEQLRALLTPLVTQVRDIRVSTP